MHPDRHGNSHAASERFKGIVRAYEAALRMARGGRVEGPPGPSAAGPVTAPEAPAPAPPIRERYACPRCDDTFPVADTCPRCADSVTDTWGGSRPTVTEDPRIAELVARLERGPRFEVPDLPIPEAARPWLGAAAFMTAGWATAGVGLVALGGLLGLFGLTVGSLAAHEWAMRGARARLFLF